MSTHELRQYRAMIASLDPFDAGQKYLASENSLIVELEPSSNGDYYSIISGSRVKTKYLDRFPLIWEPN